MKVWFVSDPQEDPTVGYEDEADASAALATLRENLRASGNDTYDQAHVVEIEIVVKSGSVGYSRDELQKHIRFQSSKIEDLAHQLDVAYKLIGQEAVSRRLRGG